MKWPSIIFSSAALLQCHEANAGWDEVEAVLLRMESVALGLRDELEIAYTGRCDSVTLEQCANRNYHDCSSEFPNPQCGLIFDDINPHSLCQCGLMWDTTTTTVTMPNALLGKEELIETICYSRMAEQYIINSFHDEYWEENNLQLGSIFFGSADGIFRRIPARQTEECGWYDPRVRPWYNAASGIPKAVFLVIDLSRSMDGYSLLTAKLAAISIINTLTVLDRATIITFSSVAEILLGGNIFIEGTDPNKKKLAEAIDMLEPSNGTSNLYNAFNLTFDSLSNLITSGNSTRCNIAVIVLTNGQVDDGQSEADASKVVSFVQEQTQMLAANYSARAVVFTYTVGDEADTSLAKQIACSTGGIWKHLGEAELIDVLSSLSSYYELFSTGLVESEYVSWIEPYFWVLDGRWATSVGVPVFDRSVTPYRLLGVAGVGIYMDSLERIHGENSTKSLFQKWIMKSSMEACPAIELTECQLEALRFFGGGENTTCGLCNNTVHDASNICPVNTSSPINVWHNIDHHEVEYTERGCCESSEALSSDTCPSPESSKSGGGHVSRNAVIAIMVLFAPLLV